MIIQYPHILKYDIADKSGDTTTVTPVERTCRIEYGSSALQGVARNDKPAIGIIYCPLPFETIEIDTQVSVFDGERLIHSGAVMQFREGQLNARIWV